MNLLKIARIIIPITLFISSCAISINENGYRFLTEEEKSYFQPFSNNVFDKPVINRDSLKFYEISASDIRAITKQSKYTCIVLWAPFCSSKESKNLPNLLCDMREKYSQVGLQSILISTTYNIKELKTAFSNSLTTCPVFVLQSSKYGTKQGKAFRQLANELDNNALISSNDYYSVYLFKDTILINACWNLTENQMDSILFN